MFSLCKIFMLLTKSTAKEEKEKNKYREHQLFPGWISCLRCVLSWTLYKAEHLFWFNLLTKKCLIRAECSGTIKPQKPLFSFLLKSNCLMFCTSLKSRTCNSLVREWRILFMHPGLHPFLLLIRGMDHRDCSLSREAQTSLSPATTSSLVWKEVLCVPGTPTARGILLGWLLSMWRGSILSPTQMSELTTFSKGESSHPLKKACFCWYLPSRTFSHYISSWPSVRVGS